MIKNKLAPLCMTAVLLCLAPGSARSEADFPVVTSVQANYAGLAIASVPDYMGSDDYQIGVMPAFRYEFGDHRDVELIGNYLSFNLVDHDILRFGPAFRYRLARDSDIDDAVVKRMREVDESVEAGLMVEGSWILNNDPRNRFAAGVDALWDTSGVSNGWNGMVYARYWQPVSAKVDLGVSANMMYGNNDFNETYFGVNTADSTATGLPQFSAGGGVDSFSIQPMLAYHINESWHLGLGLRFTRLTADAADSPVTDARGSENQFIGGVGLVYSWGAKVITR